MSQTLPSITITDAQYERVKAVIPGVTNQEKSDAYKVLVHDMLRALVIANDIRVAAEGHAAELELIRISSETNPDNL